MNFGRPAYRAFVASAIALVSTAANLAKAEDAPDPAAKQFMTSCGVCHTTDQNAEVRQGPNLRTAFGRAAGTLAEFPTYSEALKKAGAGGLVWNEETLDKWIANASEFVAGSSMMYSQPDAEKRKLIVSYLKSLAAQGGAEKK